MKRKAEGIALLSLYNDEDEEEEEQDEDEDTAAGQAGPGAPESPSVATSARAGSSIVDYAHDEAAASPRRENRKGVSQAEQAEIANSEAAASDTVGNATAVSEPSQEERITDGENPDERLLAQFLPPPPATKCSDELQAKFARFLSLMDAGKSFNEELRNSKGYRNPDFLQRAVIHQGVDQIGSCFRKEIFDPHGYDPDDFYDALALEQKREVERREQERKQNQRIEFERATQIAKMMQQKGPVVNAAAAVPSLNETAPKPEGRTNKKSKWDKVEPDTRMISGLSISAQNALAVHAALISANAAGAAHTLAQQQQKLEQKRKEEEKPKTERSKSARKGERS